MPFSLTQPLRIVTLDDQPIFLRGVNALLSQEPNIVLAGSASNEADLMHLLEQKQANVLLMDHAMSPGQSPGINLIKTVTQHDPQLNVLVISSFYSTTTVALALRNGAKGFICKHAAEGVMLKAVQAVGRGEIYLEPEMAILLARMHEEVVQAEIVPEQTLSHTLYIDQVDVTSLSPKVQGVMRCLLEGMTVTQIARKFSRSIKTISGQKQAGMRKLGIRNDYELMLLRNNT